MNRPDTALAGSSAAVRRASHTDENYEQDIKDCGELIARRGGLDYIAHLTCGIWDFAVHLGTPAWEPKVFDQAARQLNVIAARLDETAEPLDSGPLIRVVIEGNNGALFHIVKVAGQNFFAATMDGTPETVDRADRNLAQIANKSAQRVGAPSLLWGGYRKRGESVDNLFLPGKTPPPEVFPARPGVVPESAAALCRAALDRNDVHFVGIYRHDTLVWRADLFTDPALRSFFQRVTPASRRHGYDRLLEQVTLHAGRILQLLSLVHSDALTRLVLDVARGAVYVLPLGDHEHYLVGVTLMQTQVEDADKKMMGLHGDLTATTLRLSGTSALPGLLRPSAAARVGQPDRGGVDPVA